MTAFATATATGSRGDDQTAETPATSTLPPVLELERVVKEYPGTYAGTPPVRALAEVSLTVRSGEMVAIVGPSGSGKSTMLNLIGALDRPSQGTARVAGSDLAALGDRQLSALRARRIGFVFQQFHLLPGLTARDNVALGLVYQGVPRVERRRRATEALGRVGLARRADHRPTMLSGGEQQRVAIARAVAGQPAIVLADEPTGNLDTATGREVLDTFHSLHQEGTTIVLITHDLKVAAAAPRVVTLRDGQVEADVQSHRVAGRAAPGRERGAS